MKTLQWLVAGIVVGVIVAAFRDFERREWLAPAIPRRAIAGGGEEPILGYDGMDQETLIHWLAAADLDEDTVRQVIDYEAANYAREPVIEALQELLA